MSFGLRIHPAEEHDGRLMQIAEFFHMGTGIERGYAEKGEPYFVTRENPVDYIMEHRSRDGSLSNRMGIIVSRDDQFIGVTPQEGIGAFVFMPSTSPDFSNLGAHVDATPRSAEELEKAVRTALAGLDLVDPEQRR